MKPPLVRYFELMQEYPHLFLQPEDDGLVIITDPEEIRREREAFRNRLAAQGKPSGWLVIGVLVEDPWHLIIRDLVRFPGGQVGGYLRIINRKSLQGGFNVVILPRRGEEYLLLRHFRHDDRAWHWEFPRGFGEPGLTAEECAQKEIQEELGVTGVTLIELLCEPEGVDGGTTYFLAEIPSDVPIALEREEGISNSIWVQLSELEDMIRRGELEDMFSLKIYLLNLLKNNS